MKDQVTDGYGDPLAAGDDRFARHVVPVTTIVTSHGQHDSGMFALNLQDARFAV